MAPPIFDGLRFWLSSTVPSKSSYAERIRSNGGIIVAEAHEANLRIVDHLRKHNPPDSLSFTYVDSCLRSGILEPETDFQVAAASAPAAVRRTRNQFSPRDDQICREYGLKLLRQREADLGNLVWEVFASEHPQHTAASWRDHWKHALNKDPALQAARNEAQENRFPSATQRSQAATDSRIRTSTGSQPTLPEHTTPQEAPANPPSREKTPKALQSSQQNSARVSTAALHPLDRPSEDDDTPTGEEGKLAEARAAWRVWVDSTDIEWSPFDVEEVLDILIQGKRLNELNPASEDEAWREFQVHHPNFTAAEWQCLWRDRVESFYRSYAGAVGADGDYEASSSPPSHRGKLWRDLDGHADEINAAERDVRTHKDQMYHFDSAEPDSAHQQVDGDERNGNEATNGTSEIATYETQAAFKDVIPPRRLIFPHSSSLAAREQPLSSPSPSRKRKHHRSDISNESPPKRAAIALSSPSSRQQRSQKTSDQSNIRLVVSPRSISSAKPPSPFGKLPEATNPKERTLPTTTRDNQKQVSSSENMSLLGDDEIDTRSSSPEFVVPSPERTRALPASDLSMLANDGRDESMHEPHAGHGKTNNPSRDLSLPKDDLDSSARRVLEPIALDRLPSMRMQENRPWSAASSPAAARTTLQDPLDQRPQSDSFAGISRESSLYADTPTLARDIARRHAGNASQNISKATLGAGGISSGSIAKAHQTFDDIGRDDANSKSSFKQTTPSSTQRLRTAPYSHIQTPPIGLAETPLSDQLKSWTQSHTKHPRTPLPVVREVLQACSMQTDLADDVLVHIRRARPSGGAGGADDFLLKGLLPDWPGVWTPEDDSDLQLQGGGRGLQRVLQKHNTDEVDRRLSFHRELPSGGML